MLLTVLGLAFTAKKTANEIKKATYAVNDLSEKLTPLVQPGVRLLQSAALLNISAAFASSVGGICAIINTYSGVQAQAKLISIYEELGDQVKNIAASLKSIDANIGELVNHRNQHDFADHVYDLISMRSEEEAAHELGFHGDDTAMAIPAPHLQSYFFIYHKGTEWWPRFHRLVRDHPIPNLCGMTTDLDSLVAYMIEFRKIVGPKPTFRILIPATTLFFVADPLALPKSVGKLIIEGEIHNQTGMPYVHVNIPEAPDSTFYNVQNVWRPEASDKGGKGWGRWVASTTAAWAVGLPSACVATPGGMLAGGVLMVAAAPVLPAVLATEGVFLGAVALGGMGAGAASGTMSAMFTGKKVEEAWDRSEARRQETAQGKTSEKKASNKGSQG